MNRLLIFSFMLCGSFAAGQSTFCSQTRNTVYCNDGTAATRSGNTLYFRDGAATAHAVNTIDLKALLPSSSLRNSRPPENQKPSLQMVSLEPQQESWNVPLDKALQDLPPQLLESFVKQCMSVPHDFRQQSAQNRKLLADTLATVDAMPSSEEMKAQTRQHLQASLEKVLSQPQVPDYWRIDSADDFHQCLEANERDWQNTLLLNKRHKNYVHMNEATQTAMVEYLEDHFEVPRFVVFTLEQSEEAYKALKAAGRFQTQK